MGFSLEQFLQALKDILTNQDITQEQKIVQTYQEVLAGEKYAKECGIINPTCERCGAQSNVMSDWLVKNLCTPCSIIKANQ